jgi:(p)ppGpp synthase/HD superfamily hydrolase
VAAPKIDANKSNGAGVKAFVLSETWFFIRALSPMCSKIIKESNSTDVLEKAKSFAVSAHDSINQRRKYTGEPYYFHCERVVKILSEVIADEDVLAAAWMHDILEDVAPHNPDYSEDEIRRLFGNRICEMVIELTDSKLEHGNRAARKARDRERLEAASVEVKTVKLADLIDNFIDIQNNDPSFAVVFAREIDLLLPCLSAGNPLLFSRLTELLVSYKDLRKTQAND